MPSATLFFFGGCSSLLIGFNDAAASVVNQCFSQSMPQHLPRLDSSQLVNRTPLVLRKPKIRSRHFGRVKGTDKGRKLDRLGRQGWMVTTIEYGCEHLLLQLLRTTIVHIILPILSHASASSEGIFTAAPKLLQSPGHIHEAYGVGLLINLSGRIDSP